MSRPARLHEIPDPQGGRNLIRAGDPVRVSAGLSDAQSFRAKFLYAEAAPDGSVAAIVVIGGRGYVPGLPTSKQTGVAEFRTLSPSRIRRISVAHHERKLDLTEGEAA